MSKHKKFSTRRIVIDALLISLFFVLSLFSVELGGVKITFVSLPTVVCAMLYGPVDACIVGFLGAFLEQMMKYGFTATTVLWLLPAAIRGLVIGLGVVLFRKQMSLEAIAVSKKPFVYYAVCLVGTSDLLRQYARLLRGFPAVPLLFLRSDLRCVLGPPCQRPSHLVHHRDHRTAGRAGAA